jgi:hypothetical protein
MKVNKTVICYFKNMGTSGELIDKVVIELVAQLKKGDEVILVDKKSQDKTYAHLLEDSNWVAQHGFLSRVYKEEEFPNKEIENTVALDFTKGFREFELYPKIKKYEEPTVRVYNDDKEV